MQLFPLDSPEDLIPSSDGRQIYLNLKEVDKDFYIKWYQYLLWHYINATQELQIQRLKNLCYTDDLTQLRNQRYFNLRLKNVWEELAVLSAPLSLILLDIDNLKIYNLMRGQKMGDKCVYDIASQISRCVDNKNALVARYQDDAFAVILPEVTLSHAVEISETIREEVQNLNIKHAIAKIGGLQFPVVTVSLGVVTTIPKIQKSPTTLIDAAFSALHRAKKLGGNCTYTSQNV